MNATAKTAPKATTATATATKATANAKENTMKAKATAQIKANAKINTAPVKAKAKATAKPIPKPEPAAVREVSNKIKPVGTDPAVKNAKPAKPAKPAKTAPIKATSTTTAPIISTGDAELDKRYGVGQIDTLPEDFRSVSTAERLERINSAEADLETNWNQLGKFYGYSVIPVIAELVAAGQWPMRDKTDRKGQPVKGPDGKTQQVPQTYKQVYDAEVEANIKAVGHWVNRASNRFSAHKPEELKRAANKTTAASTAKAKARRKSNLQQAIEYVASLTPEEIAQFVQDELVKDALDGYLIKDKA